MKRKIVGMLVCTLLMVTGFDNIEAQKVESENIADIKFYKINDEYSFRMSPSSIIMVLVLEYSKSVYKRLFPTIFTIFF